MNEIRRKASINDIVYTVISGVATIATVYILIRVIAGPDSMKTVNMRMAKTAERFCQSQAEIWAHLADISARVYNNSRNVTA